MEFIKRNWKHTLMIIILLFITYKCANDYQHETQGKQKQLEQELKKAKDGVKVLEDYKIRLQDSVKKVIDSSKQVISDLERRNSALSSSILAEKEKTRKKKDKLKNYTYKDYADSFNERYKTNTVKYTDTSIIAQDSVPQQITEELIEKDELQEIVKIQEEIIDNKDGVIKQKDVIISTKDKQLKTSEDLILAQKEENRIQEEMNNNAKKTIRGLKVKNTIGIIVIPLAFLSGFLLPR